MFDAYVYFGDASVVSNDAILKCSASPAVQSLQYIVIAFEMVAFGSPAHEFT